MEPSSEETIATILNRTANEKTNSFKIVNIMTGYLYCTLARSICLHFKHQRNDNVQLGKKSALVSIVTEPFLFGRLKIFVRFIRLHYFQCFIHFSKHNNIATGNISAIIKRRQPKLGQFFMNEIDYFVRLMHMLFA